MPFQLVTELDTMHNSTRRDTHTQTHQPRDEAIFHPRLAEITGSFFVMGAEYLNNPKMK